MAAPKSTNVPDQISRYAEVVTPSDATTLVATRGLYVGGAGHVSVVMAGDGATVLFSALPVGTLLPISVTKVNSTGTTATLVVALW